MIIYNICMSSFNPICLFENAMIGEFHRRLRFSLNLVQKKKELRFEYFHSMFNTHARKKTKFSVTLLNTTCF